MSRKKINQTETVFLERDGREEKVAYKKHRSRDELLSLLLEQARLLEARKIGTVQALFDIVREYNDAGYA